MTPEQISAIAARANAATPATFELICARQDIPLLLAHVAAQAAEVERLKEALKEYADETNWCISKQDNMDDRDWFMGEGHGFLLARAALAAKENGG